MFSPTDEKTPQYIRAGRKSFGHTVQSVAARSIVNKLINFHPRRPSGSQSGREKRRDESFQARAKEPLGTDSHRTISKKSSGCRLLIGHKKCFVFLCPMGEQFLLSSFRELVHDGYCLATLGWFIKLVRARNTFIFYFPKKTKERLGCYQQEQFNFPREYSVFDGSQCIVNNRNFKMQQQRESQISNSFARQNNNFARVSRFFVPFFAVNCTTSREHA